MTTPLNDASAGEAYLTTLETANQILAHRNPEAQVPPAILAALRDIVVQSENRLRVSIELSVIRTEVRLANEIQGLRRDVNALQNAMQSMTDGTTQVMIRARDALPNRPNQ